MAVKTLDDIGNFQHPLYQKIFQLPGLSIGTAAFDDVMSWGLTNALWLFPMATSCCGIEFMATAASRVDVDRMGTIVRGTPRQADVMVVAGTITVKMAPRVLKLWEQMPEPKWCIAMGSCAISGDFYRNLYSVVPGIDTFLPVDVYVPGCPPNPEALMHGLLRLQEKINATRKGQSVVREPNPDLLKITKPSVPRLCDAARPANQSELQLKSAAEATVLENVGPLDTGEAPAIPSVENATPKDFEALLKEDFGVTEFPKNAPPIVPVERHLELTARLKKMGYKQFVYVVASHWMAGKAPKGVDVPAERIEVAYGLRMPGPGSKVASWALRVAPDQPVPTISGLFAGADWQEREQWDLVGLKFKGHPDLRRLMLPENYQGHPLRKDFAIDAPAAPWR